MLIKINKSKIRRILFLWLLVQINSINPIKTKYAFSKFVFSRSIMLIKNLVQKLKNSIFINSLKAKIRNTCTLCLLKGYIQIDIHFHSQYTNLLLKRKKIEGKSFSY